MRIRALLTAVSIVALATAVVAPGTAAARPSRPAAISIEFDDGPQACSFDGCPPFETGTDRRASASTARVITMVEGWGTRYAATGA